MRALWIGFLVAGMCAACGGDDEGGSGDDDSGGMNSGGGSDTNGSSGSGGGMGAAGTGSDGGDDIAVDPAASDGQVVAPWDQFCVATFNRDYDIIDTFGDVELSVQAGDRYLLGESGFFADATIIYITDDGQVELELDGDANGTLPFTSSCVGNSETRIGVFADTVVYADAELTMPECTLQAGLTVAGGGVNFIISDGGTLFSPIYQVELNELSAACDGVSDGFVESVSVDVGTTTYGSVAFSTLLAPAQ